MPVRQAHIEDGCEDSLEEKRDGLYSTETWLCACIIENERLRPLPFAAPQKRGLSQFIASVEVVSCCPDVPYRGMYSLLFDSAAPNLHMNC